MFVRTDEVIQGVKPRIRSAALSKDAGICCDRPRTAAETVCFTCPMMALLTQIIH